MKTATKTKFRQTEVGMIPENWETRLLRELVDVKGRIGWRGYTIEDLRDEGPLVIGGTQIVDNRLDLSKPVYVSEEKFEQSPEIKVKRLDIILTKTGNSIGDVAIVNSDIGRATINPNVALLKNKDKINPHFLYYWLLSKYSQEYLRSGSSASAQPAINQETLKKLIVPFPTREEQDSIARILSDMDGKIELNQQMNKTFEAMARAVFKHWFIDFEFPNEEGKPYKSSGGEMVSSECGELPKEWKAVAFLDAFDINPPHSLNKGQVAPYVEMANMPNDSARILGYVDRPFTSGTRFTDGDTLVARITPCLENGKTAFVDFVGAGRVGWGSTEYIVLRPRTPLPPEFGYFLARTEYFRMHAISNMTGTSGRQRVPVDCFDNFMFVMPAAQTVGHFGKFARACLSFMKKNDNESKTLTSIRDMLLPKLMPGKIRVPVEPR